MSLLLISGVVNFFRRVTINGMDPNSETPQIQKPNYFYIAAAIIVIALVAIVVFWHVGKNKTAPLPEGQSGIGAKIFDEAQNPVRGELPDTNPFSADTNPFDAPTNPFKSEYTNPFK